MKNFVALGAPSLLQVKSLSDRGYSVIDLPRFSLLSEPVSCHADMLFSYICGKLVTSALYYSSAQVQLDEISLKLGAEIVLDTHSDFSHYPDEARFNTLFHEGFLFANKKAVSPLISDICEKNNIGFIHVNQGYAACSSAVCGKGIITADSSIYSAVTDAGFTALRISEGHISLPGYSYGFIGGASGFCKKTETLYFNGDIENHPDYRAIQSFSESLGVNIVSLGCWPLTDCGGMFFF